MNGKIIDVNYALNIVWTTFKMVLVRTGTKKLIILPTTMTHNKHCA